MFGSLRCNSYFDSRTRPSIGSQPSTSTSNSRRTPRCHQEASCKAQHLDAVQITLEQIDVIRRLVEFNSQHFALVRSSNEILDVHKKGRIASLIGVEGGHALGNSLAVLRTFYNLGARYLTITHSCDTPWARGTNSQDEIGLTPFGQSVIKEMNRLGMIIDLSHTSMNTARAAMNFSHAPVIFSHSSAYTLCNSSRNVPDDIHLTCNETASMKDVINHINHIRSIAGVNHVGIGAGYDGINMTPSGLEDVSRYPHLLAELLADPAWSEKEIALLAGLNLHWRILHLQWLAIALPRILDVNRHCHFIFGSLFRAMLYKWFKTLNNQCILYTRLGFIYISSQLLFPLKNLCPLSSIEIFIYLCTG